MPTYEYECRSCDHHFEKSQSMTAEPLKTCPKCGKNRVVRLISSGSGFIFKGSGFYATDYKKGSPPTQTACPSAGTKSGCSHCPKS
ncbi:MAG: FmdB family transcriptional regulator [Candidatus Omnitrophica bacterium CG_4_10_14_0_2_um_filter_44_9]|nr:MAG: FmdB family transcriptional regulator [Candidatus Omnitrophica bacterium CG_4_10_14_0_8_um_filter_44_12]PIZ83416.1 MAG: FmdB family transcriptional regulator [Candidatus Omnitrophica bacterium CG_4_10_14_0_2_um_filter_44_9]